MPEVPYQGHVEGPFGRRAYLTLDMPVREHGYAGITLSVVQTVKGVPYRHVLHPFQYLADVSRDPTDEEYLRYFHWYTARMLKIE